jgi:hypothetical protein
MALENKDLTLSKLLTRHFRSANDISDGVTARTRIDARTVSYPDENDISQSTYMAMVPVSLEDDNDAWEVFKITEKRNKYLSQISEHERLVKLSSVSSEPMSFKKAMERLGVWELSRLMKGTEPSGKDRAEIGANYYRDVGIRRGYLLDSTGNLVEVSKIIPKDEGTFLKSDLEALRRYRGKLEGSDKLDLLFNAQQSLYVITDEDLDNTGTVQDDLESFGEIALFEKMQFYSEILVEYAKVQLSYIEEFYGHPERFSDRFENKKSLADQMNNHASFFNEVLIKRINHTREQFSETIFKYFHVAEQDWDKELNFNSRAMKKQMMINPDAKETFELMNRPVEFPLKSSDVEQLLFIAARSITFCSEMLKDSPQKDRLEDKDLYKSSDIKDLLNFLDLLDVKYMYTTLAESASALPHTQRYKDLKRQNEQFSARVDYLIANLEDSSDWSPAQKEQIDEFIKAKSEVYLLDKIKELPKKLSQTHEYLSGLLLPRPHQLSLNLDDPQISFEDRYKNAAPTRKSKRVWSRFTNE